MKKKELKRLVFQQAETIRKLHNENVRLEKIFTDTRIFLNNEISKYIEDKD